ncbi:hypothetical protein Aab01nite_64790 [Paractinoplanes abujensis]|nr:hypothetical protein Aab01nite_64790 [Actinoplanes abujensis]
MVADPETPDRNLLPCLLTLIAVGDDAAWLPGSVATIPHMRGAARAGWPPMLAGHDVLAELCGAARLEPATPE